MLFKLYMNKKIIKYIGYSFLSIFLILAITFAIISNPVIAIFIGLSAYLGNSSAHHFYYTKFKGMKENKELNKVVEISFVIGFLIGATYIIINSFKDI